MTTFLAYWQPILAIILLGAVLTHSGRVALWWIFTGLVWHLPRWGYRRAVRHEEPCDAGHRHDRFFTAEQAEVIRHRAGGQCERHDPETGERCQAFYGAPGVSMESDHVVAKTHGGPTVVDNGQALCRPCNGAKSGRLVTRHELATLAAHRAGYWPTRRLPRPERYLP